MGSAGQINDFAQKEYFLAAAVSENVMINNGKNL